MACYDCVCGLLLAGRGRVGVEFVMPIRFECWPPRQKGGQTVGPGPCGVRGVYVTDDGYEPGIEACCQLHRSQHKNRIAVQEMIEWALLS